MSGQQNFKICYDFRFIQEPNSGLAKYSWSVLVNLIESNLCKDILVLIPLGMNPKIMEKLSAAPHVKTLELTFGPFHFKNLFLQSILRNETGRDCVYFYPHFNAPLFMRNTVFVVHDLLPLIIDDYFGQLRQIKRIYFRCTLMLSLLRHKCVAVSESTKQDLLDFFPKQARQDKISVLTEDIPLPYPSENNMSPSKPKEKEYLFYIGDWRAHKNLIGMLELQQMLYPKNKQRLFLVAGSSKDYSSLGIKEKIENTPGAKHIGRLDDRELEHYLDHCKALFFLTKYEGFGLPILEAGFRGKAIITSNVGGCDEIAPPWACRINPNAAAWDNIKIVQAYLEHFAEPTSIEIQEYRNKFSWRNTATFIANFQDRCAELTA